MFLLRKMLRKETPRKATKAMVLAPAQKEPLLDRPPSIRTDTLPCAKHTSFLTISSRMRGGRRALVSFRSCSGSGMHSGPQHNPASSSLV